MPDRTHYVLHYGPARGGVDVKVTEAGHETFEVTISDHGNKTEKVMTLTELNDYLTSLETIWNG